ncbi:GGDEF domain-containing protein [Deinococcus roseus]|nr:GGDEF domain-containing protein [Deinococcus roseus]
MLPRFKTTSTEPQQDASRRPTYLLVMGLVVLVGWFFSVVVLDAVPLIHWIVNGAFGLLTVLTLLLAFVPGTLAVFEVGVTLVINFGMLSTVVVGLLDHPRTYDPLEYVMLVPMAYLAAFSFLGVWRGTLVCFSVFVATVVITLRHYLPILDHLTDPEAQAFRILQLHYIASIVEIGGLYGLTTFLERQTRARVQAEATARFAFIDPLTGLGNRRRFQQVLEGTLKHAQHDGTGFALMFVDLDHFKQVNDLHGHQAGDALLQQISSRLAQSIRQTDLLARISGDEFAIVADGISEARTATALADKLIAALAAEFALADLKLKASASIGISLYPQHGETAQELLAHADQAMYLSKSRGRHGYTLYGTEQIVPC